jgi:hypothetical protein
MIVARRKTNSSIGRPRVGVKARALVALTIFLIICIMAISAQRHTRRNLALDVVELEF